MKTVHVITRMIVGGAQENTLLTVEGQHRDYGDDVTLVTGPTEGREGSLIDRARRGGFDVIEVPSLIRAISPVHEVRATRELCRLFRELDPEIVHTHSGKAGLLGRTAAARVGVPVVHTVHGPSFYRGQSPLAYRVYLAAEKWAAKRTDRFITVCDAMADQYAAAGVAPRDAFVTVYSGMDVEPFLEPPRPRDEVRAELGFAAGDVVVAKVARLFHEKGHDDLIAAAERVATEHAAAKFLLIGDGILREQFVADVARRGLAERFVFTGLVPPSQVAELIHAADVVAHASYREGLARVLPQGLIAGKPVVSYAIDGAPEVCIDGETGYLIDFRDVAGLAKAIGRLVGDAALRDRLGAEGRGRFTDRFRHQTMTRRIREVYANVLAGR
ncbi:MAG: glycosyltransferase family 4 protein [Planctomycetota bacterium]